MHFSFLLLLLTTNYSIHERSAREKISADQVAHVLNDEVSRKYIQSLKRCVAFLVYQVIHFTHPSSFPQAYHIFANKVPSCGYLAAYGIILDLFAHFFRRCMTTVFGLCVIYRYILMVFHSVSFLYSIQLFSYGLTVTASSWISSDSDWAFRQAQRMHVLCPVHGRRVWSCW